MLLLYQDAATLHPGYIGLSYFFLISSFMPVSMVRATSTISVPFISGYLSNNAVHTSLDNGFGNVEVRNSYKSPDTVI